MSSISESINTMVIVSALPLFYMVGGGNKTTTSTILMSLSQLVGVNNFCSSLLSTFLLIILILSSWAIMFRILLYTILRFPWLALLPFPVVSTSMTSCICELVSRHMTWWYHADSFEWSYPQSSEKHQSYHKEHQSTPYQ